MSSKERDCTEDYLISEKLIKKLRYCHRRYLPFMQFEDVLQEYRLTILEGKSENQTLDQFSIDLYRKNKKYLQEKQFTEGEEEDAIYFNPKIHDVMLKLQGLSGYDRIIVFMICVYGISIKEIAVMLDVSEARISRVVDIIVRRLNAKNS